MPFERRIHRLLRCVDGLHPLSWEAEVRQIQSDCFNEFFDRSLSIPECRIVQT